MKLRYLWLVLLGLVLTGLPAIEAADGPATACEAMDKKANVAPVACIVCCLVPSRTTPLAAPLGAAASPVPLAIAALTSVEPKAISPPPRVVQVSFV